MPYDWEFDSEHRILLVIYEGEVHDWEMSEASNELRPRFANLQATAVIADFSAVTNADVAGGIVRHEAKVDVSYLQRVPFIMVAPHKHLFGLARMYELSAKPVIRGSAGGAQPGGSLRRFRRSRSEVRQSNADGTARRKGRFTAR